MSRIWDKTAKAGIKPALRVSQILMKGKVFAMSYEVFRRKVNALIRKAGGGINVRFSTDPEKGKHYANCSDGTTIIGNEISLRVSVLWGSGHQSVAAI